MNNNQYTSEKAKEENSYIILGLKHFRDDLQKELEISRKKNSSVDEMLALFYAENIFKIELIIKKRQRQTTQK